MLIKNWKKRTYFDSGDFALSAADRVTDNGATVFIQEESIPTVKASRILMLLSQLLVTLIEMQTNICLGRVQVLK